MWWIRQAGLALAAGTVVSLAASCDGATAPLPINLRVSLATAGVDEDADGYLILVGGASVRHVQPDGRIEMFLAPGTHDVRLDGIAPNCSLQGPDAVSVTTTTKDLVDVAFSVECRAVTGAIEVAAPTSGRDFDPDGYTVTVDGGAGPAGATTVFAGGSVTLLGIPPGSHEVTLSGLSDNCAASGSNTRTVSVTAGGLTRDTVRTEFVVVCETVTGDVRISTATTGDDQDPDGYTLLFDGEPVLEDSYYYYYYGYEVPLRLSPNNSRLLGQVLPGDHTYELTDIAPNCTVDGTNPRTVSVSIGAVSDVLFHVVCTDLP